MRSFAFSTLHSPAAGCTGGGKKIPKGKWEERRSALLARPSSLQTSTFPDEKGGRGGAQEEDGKPSIAAPTYAYLCRAPALQKEKKEKNTLCSVLYGGRGKREEREKMGPHAPLLSRCASYRGRRGELL